MRNRAKVRHSLTSAPEGPILALPIVGDLLDRRIDVWLYMVNPYTDLRVESWISCNGAASISFTSMTKTASWSIELPRSCAGCSRPTGRIGDFSYVTWSGVPTFGCA
jgi:hypothetical protein